VTNARLFLTSLGLAILLGCGGTGFTDWTDTTTEPWGSDDDDSPAPGDDDAADDSDDDDDTVASDDDDSFITDDDDDDTSDLYEGDDPGECTDGADNDLDGWFDCDDVGCFGSPDCEDEAGADDDDLAGDDDDTSPPPGDDDDVVGADPGAPLLTSVTTVWNASTGEFEFTLYMSDGDCDLGLPTIYWSVDGDDQSPASLSGTPLTCSGTIYFYVGGLTAGNTYTFGFWIDDDLGNLSAPYTVTVTAA
jgi:hypothetical protein